MSHDSEKILLHFLDSIKREVRDNFLEQKRKIVKKEIISKVKMEWKDELLNIEKIQKITDDFLKSDEKMESDEYVDFIDELEVSGFERDEDNKIVPTFDNDVVKELYGCDDHDFIQNSEQEFRKLWSSLLFDTYILNRGSKYNNMFMSDLKSYLKNNYNITINSKLGE
jgi:hypothetical protein